VFGADGSGTDLLRGDAAVAARSAAIGTGGDAMLAIRARMPGVGSPLMSASLSPQPSFVESVTLAATLLALQLP
jgi:hypothetical protein